MQAEGVSPEAIEVYNKYQLCKKFRCLPSKLDSEDAMMIEIFERMLSFENTYKRPK